MSDQNENTQDQETANLAEASEMLLLKDRAKMMGIGFSPNIGLETLRQRITDKLAEDSEGGSEVSQGENNNEGFEDENGAAVPELKAAVAVASPRVAEVAPAPELDYFQDAMRLIRVRIQCLNPNKQALRGEIHGVGNAVIGVVKKFVPYGEGSDEGYHLPNILYKYLKEKQYLKTSTVKVDGREQLRTSWVREFAIDELPPLTQAELQQLATAQMAEGIVEHVDALDQ